MFFPSTRRLPRYARNDDEGMDTGFRRYGNTYERCPFFTTA